MIISVQVYNCNHHSSIALACTETGIKTSLKRKKKEKKTGRRSPSKEPLQWE